MNILFAVSVLVVYAEDPVFYADDPLGIHAVVEHFNVGTDAGDCVIWNTFGEGDPVYYYQEQLAHSVESVMIGKIRLILPDNSHVWLTLEEMDEFARSKCLSEDLLG